MKLEGIPGPSPKALASLLSATPFIKDLFFVRFEDRVPSILHEAAQERQSATTKLTCHTVPLCSRGTTISKACWSGVVIWLG